MIMTETHAILEEKLHKLETEHFLLLESNANSSLAKDDHDTLLYYKEKVKTLENQLQLSHEMISSILHEIPVATSSNSDTNTSNGSKCDASKGNDNDTCTNTDDAIITNDDHKLNCQNITTGVSDTALDDADCVKTGSISNDSTTHCTDSMVDLSTPTPNRRKKSSLSSSKVLLTPSIKKTLENTATALHDKALSSSKRIKELQMKEETESIAYNATYTSASITTPISTKSIMTVAQRSKYLEDELNDAKEVLQSERNQYSRSINDLTYRIRELEKVNEILMVSNKENETGMRRLQIDSNNCQLLRDELAEAHLKNKQLSDDCTNIEAELKQLQQRLHQQVEIDTTTGSINGDDAICTSDAMETLELRVQIQELETLNQQLQSKLDDMVATAHATTSQLGVTNVTCMCSEYKAKIAEAESKNESLNEQIIAVYSELSTYIIDTSKLEAKVQAKELELKDAKAEIVKLTDDVAATKQLIKAMQVLNPSAATDSSKICSTTTTGTNTDDIPEVSTLKVSPLSLHINNITSRTQPFPLPTTPKNVITSATMHARRNTVSSPVGVMPIDRHADYGLNQPKHTANGSIVNISSPHISGKSIQSPLSIKTSITPNRQISTSSNTVSPLSTNTRKESPIVAMRSTIKDKHNYIANAAASATTIADAIPIATNNTTAITAIATDASTASGGDFVVSSSGPNHIYDTDDGMIDSYESGFGGNVIDVRAYLRKDVAAANVTSTAATRNSMHASSRTAGVTASMKQPSVSSGAVTSNKQVLKSPVVRARGSPSPLGIKSINKVLSPEPTLKGPIPAPATVAVAAKDAEDKQPVVVQNPIAAAPAAAPAAVHNHITPATTGITPTVAATAASTNLGAPLFTFSATNEAAKIPTNKDVPRVVARMNAAAATLQTASANGTLAEPRRSSSTVPLPAPTELPTETTVLTTIDDAADFLVGIIPASSILSDTADFFTSGFSIFGTPTPTPATTQTANK